MTPPRDPVTNKHHCISIWYSHEELHRSMRKRRGRGNCVRGKGGKGEKGEGSTSTTQDSSHLDELDGDFA